MRKRVSLSFAVMCACGGSHGHGDPASSTLTIDPPTSTLMIVDNVPATEDFTATRKWPDGYTEDVTSDVVFSIDGAFGSFTGNHLSMQTAGKTQVFGQIDTTMGSAQVIAMLKGTRIDPSLPGNTPDLFNMPEDPSRAPTVVYPAHDVIVPRNLGDFEVHWTDAHGTEPVRKRMISVEMPMRRSISATAAGGASMFRSEKCALRFFLIL
jgi:hypothetical protein